MPRTQVKPARRWFASCRHCGWRVEARSIGQAKMLRQLHVCSPRPDDDEGYADPEDAAFERRDWR
jgi:hypothetical protein